MANKTPEELEQWRQVEQALLGAVLTPSDCLEKISGITSNSFQSRKHRRIWAAIEALQKAETPVDVVTVAEYLTSKGQLTDVGGLAYFEILMAATPNLENTDHYVRSILAKQHQTEQLLKLDVAREAIKCGNSEEAARALSDIQHITDKATKQRFELLTAEGLVTGEFEHNWLIKGVMVSNQLCIMAAQKKCLKTNISIEMAFCLATGSPFLGKFPVPEAVKVLMISGESGKATTQETFRRIALSKGWSASQVKNLHFCFDLPSLDKAEDIQQLRRIVKELGIKVLFIDPVYLCLNLGDGMSNMFSVGEKLSQIKQLGDDTGCTIVLIHHTRKSNGVNTYAEPELEEMYGSGFAEIGRQWILLGRRAPYKPDEAGEHKLIFVAGGSAGHSQSWALDISEGSIEDEGGRIWETRLFPMQEARAEKQTEKERRKQEQKEAQDDRDIQKVLKALESAEKPLTATKIRGKSNLPTDRNNVALESLVESGDVTCEEMKAGNGKITDHYFITEGTEGTKGKAATLPPSRSSEDRERERYPIKGYLPSPVCVSESVSEEREDSDSDFPSDYTSVFPAE
ncbi:MAG: hypothetical protein CME32_08730 [Gimesia sp.]|nr:hypothetical protein [Gimesia sp.]